MWMLGRCCMEHIHTSTVGSIQIPPFEKTSTRLGGKETMDLEQMSAKETAVCGHIPNCSMGIDYHHSKVWLWSCQVLSHCAWYRSVTDGGHVERLLARHEHLEEGDSRRLCHDLTVYSQIMEDFVHLWALDNRALSTDMWASFFKNIAFLCSFGFSDF